MSLPKNYRVYLSIAGVSPAWIVGKIAEDIKSQLEKEAIVCRYGTPREYGGEEVCYHLGWAYAEPKKEALVNSVFVTHIDDSFKEMLVFSMRDKFDSFICMSKEDEAFLIELGYDRTKVFGLTLPVRNTYIKPLNFGIFSSCYKDKRKNEEWLLTFCRKYDETSILNFIFIGPHWGNFVKELNKLGCSFEWHCASGNMPYEYQFQQMKLSSLDYYFYMAFDGGAMGTYDAYAMGVPLFVTNDGYHQEIPYIDYPINNYEDFETHLLSILKRHKARLDFFRENNVVNYVTKLIKIWHNEYANENESYSYNVKEKRRTHYFPWTSRRALGAIKRYIYRRLKG